MMTETYSRTVNGRTLIWDVARLKALAASLPAMEISITGIHELDEEMWFGGPRKVRATCREVVDHARRIQAADLSHPVILSADGRVMDGMHRVAKAYLEGRSHIKAVRFERNPEPDEVR